jgi:hypothetical protein
LHNACYLSKINLDFIELLLVEGASIQMSSGADRDDTIDEYCRILLPVRTVTELPTTDVNITNRLESPPIGFVLLLRIFPAALNGLITPNDNNFYSSSGIEIEEMLVEREFQMDTGIGITKP